MNEAMNVFPESLTEKGRPTMNVAALSPGMGLGLNKEGEGRKSAENLAVPTLCFLVSTKDKYAVPCSQ